MRLPVLVLWVAAAGCVAATQAPRDAGAHDAGVEDAGARDGGTFDAGIHDAGVHDGGDPCAAFVITPPASLSIPRSESVSLSFTAPGAMFQQTAGELPTGMSFESDGTLFGIPQTAGAYHFELSAWNASCTTNLAVTVVVDCPRITVTRPPQTSVPLDATLIGTFTQVGAQQPVFFVSDGMLPAWASLGTNGVLVATPDRAGGFTITVKAQDPDGCSGESEPYSVSAVCPQADIRKGTVLSSGAFRDNSLFAGRDVLFQRNTDTPTQLLVTNRQAIFSIVDGGLPPGVSLDGGVIRGVPTGIPPGDGKFVVRAEFNGCAVEEVFWPLQCEFIGLPMPNTWASTNYSAGNSPGEFGWVNGSNAYHDLQKASFFDLSATEYGFVGDIRVGFGAAENEDRLSYVMMNILEVVDGGPGPSDDGDAVPISVVKNDISNGALTSFTRTRTVSQMPYSQKFFIAIDVGTPFTFPGDAGVPKASMPVAAIPTSSMDAGAALSILSNTNGDAAPGSTWEQHEDGQWARYGDPGSWNLNTSLMIFPNVCK